MNENLVIACCFILFVYLAYRPVKKSILGALDDKIKDIKGELEAAEQLKNEAKTLFEQTKNELDKFESDKEQIINDAKQSIMQSIEQEKKEFDLMIARTESSSLQIFENKSKKHAFKVHKDFIEEVEALTLNYLKQTNNGSNNIELLKSIIK